MARVIVSSGALYRQLQPHLEADAKRIEVQIRPLKNISAFTIVSNATCTEMPCETQWQGGNSVLELDKLLPALRSIQDQPITLDLHEGDTGNRLFAVKDRPSGPFESAYPHGWENVVFDL